MASKAAAFSALLADPCNGPLVPDVYPGEKGIVSRFVSDTTLSQSTGLTCGLLIYHPASGMVHTSGDLVSSSVTTLSYSYGVVSPGYGSLNTIAAKQRCLAACITAFAASASVTSITGEYACGVCSLDTLANGSSLSFDQAFTLATARGAIERRAVDIKWKPNALDSRYTTKGTFAGADASDTNVVFLVFRNFPAGLGIAARITGVLEWTPKVGTGVAPSTTTNSNPLPITDIVARMDARSPSWYQTVSGSFAQALMPTVRGMAQEVGSFAGAALRYTARAGMAALMA